MEKKRRTCTVCGGAMNEAAKAARRAYKREWNRKNRDRVKAAQARYWERKAQQQADFAEKQESPVVMDGYHALAEAITQEVTEPEPVKSATVTERLQRVAERVCDEICRHREAFDAAGADDSAYDEMLAKYCANCPLNELGG